MLHAMSYGNIHTHEIRNLSFYCLSQYFHSNLKKIIGLGTIPMSGML